MPRIPTRMITPTTMRMALRAPPPPEVGAGAEATGGAGRAGDASGAAGAGAEVSTAAPHLLQNRVPGSMLVPHELQNAIGHLIGLRCGTCSREYIADCVGNGAGLRAKIPQGLKPTFLLSHCGAAGSRTLSKQGRRSA